MKKRILIIDDERDLGDLIKNVLIKEGYLVDNAFSLEEAGEKLKFHPEVILLDNNLPDGSALQNVKDHYDLFLLCSVSSLLHQIPRNPSGLIPFGTALPPSCRNHLQ